MHPVDLGERKADKWVLRVVAVCLMAMSLLLLALAVRPVFPVDDAFISFRYALNWVRGLGLVFTEGERVGGYSNFLWVLLVGAGARVGVTPPLAARLFSMTCLLTMLALLACRHGSRGRGPGAFGAAAATVVALSPHTTLNVLSGLEAPLVALLLLGSLLALDAERVWLASCLLLLLALTRPEGVVLGTVILLAAFLSRPAGTRQTAVTAFVAGFLIPFAVYSAWRWGYYGSLIPNSIAAKSGMDTWEILRRSAGYELAFLKTYVPIGGLSLAGIALALKGQRSRRLIVPCIGALATLSVLNFYIGAGDPYVFFRRYLYPSLPVLALVTAAAAEHLAHWGDTRSRHRLLLRVAAIAVFGVQLVVLASGLGRLIQLDGQSVVRRAVHGFGQLFSQDRAPHRTGDTAEELNLHYLADWLRRRASVEQVLATSEVGIAPYYSGLRVIDTFGLVTAHVGQLAGPPGGKSDPDFVFGRRPDYIAVKVYPGCLCGGIPAESAILTDWRLQRDYDFARAFPALDAVLLVFARRREPRFTVAYDLGALFQPDNVVFVNRETGDERRDPAQASELTGNRTVASFWTRDERDATQKVLSSTADRDASAADSEAVRKWFSNWKRFVYHYPLRRGDQPAIRYQLRVPEGGRLVFGYALVKEFWSPQHGDGVAFEIRLRGPANGWTQVFSDLIDPRMPVAEPRWREVDLDLAPWAGQVVTLDFLTDPGLADHREFDFAGWGNPQIRVSRGDS